GRPQSSRIQPVVSVSTPAPTQPPVVSPTVARITQAAPLYTGVIRIVGEPQGAPIRSIAITLSSDLKSGTMMQSSKRGNFVVRFKGIWEGTELHTVTGEIIAQPVGIQWTPESFVLKFSEDGQRATYQCLADGKTYNADLTGQSEFFARIAPVYKGKISPSDVPIRIAIGANRKSGIVTETTKSGDTLVAFNGIWDGDTMHAVTGDVISKPEKARWKPESFNLRVEDDGRRLSYTCNDEGNILTAELSPP